MSRDFFSCDLLPAKQAVRPWVVTAALACLLSFGGCGRDVVGDYCSYGAVSEAQLEGCVEHVTPEVVENYNTNAARYAKGELNACLADAGPFCRQR
jgi:hypothetical protein